MTEPNYKMFWLVRLQHPKGYAFYSTQFEEFDAGAGLEDTALHWVIHSLVSVVEERDRLGQAIPQPDSLEEATKQAELLVQQQEKEHARSA